MRKRCLLFALLFSFACGDDDAPPGMDAASMDAASMDAASMDAASMDAASMDAARLDGGVDAPMDAGTRDDAARPDTGPATWSTPRGIPTPEFGVEETVDSTCGELTERAFTGLGDLEGLPAGSIVTIPAGTHDGGRVVISGNGTPCQPIFVRGAEGRTTIRAEVGITGSYVIVENLEFDLSTSESDRVGFGGSDHAVLRHSEVHGLDIRRNTTVVFLSGASHTVIWDNHIHDNGDFSAPGEIDVHGIGASETWDTWIVDNHIHNNRGDGMQFGHRADNTLGRIYIGRNDIHDNGENSVDIKEASDVIISENQLHDEPFGPVVLHDCPINAALLFNDVFNANYGVSLPSLESNCDDSLPVSLFVIGNSFSDVDEGAQGWGSGKLYFIASNSFDRVGENITVDPIGPGSQVSEDDTAFEAAAAAFQAASGIDIR